ncbi:hypothetical protein CEXT_623971 [Caerostris extrusa]|uniref:Uncharacterized protein n=1 Tax=Caerostris extrusa TaxID=172846 RepID=A0AAV4MF36_CAEEX|nr:hypothetical protein CEXT_623971 [Caerostris extrusa]
MSDDSQVQTDPETKQSKMRLGTHRCRHFQRKTRAEGAPETIGWRQRFVEVGKLMDKMSLNQISPPIILELSVVRGRRRNIVTNPCSHACFWLQWEPFFHSFKLLRANLL